MDIKRKFLGKAQVLERRVIDSFEVWKSKHEGESEVLG